MATARTDASRAAQDLPHVCAWYHGTVSRPMVQDGHFTADTYIALRLPTDGFEAWRQQGFQSWPSCPDIAPYDTINLILCIVVPKLWELVMAAWISPGSSDDDYVLSADKITNVRHEMQHARRTISAVQARSLRNITVQCKDFQAADWINFILSLARLRWGSPVENLTAIL